MVRIHPILNNENVSHFVSKEFWTPWHQSYGDNDVLERKSHDENFLTLRDINNLRNLCGEPGSIIRSPFCEIGIDDFSLDALLVRVLVGTDMGTFTVRIPKSPDNRLKPSSMHSRWHDLNVSGVTKFDEMRNVGLMNATDYFDEQLGWSDWELKWNVRLYFCRDTQWVSIDPKVTLVRDGVEVTPNLETFSEEIIGDTIIRTVTGSDDQAFAIGYLATIPLYSNNLVLE